MDIFEAIGKARKQKKYPEKQTIPPAPSVVAEVIKQESPSDREKLLLEVCDKYWVPAWERNKTHWIAEIARKPEAAIAAAQQAYLAGTGTLETVIERIKDWERALSTVSQVKVSVETQPPREIRDEKRSCHNCPQSPHWDQELVDWFLALSPPEKPFQLGPGEKIWDPQRFFKSLCLDCELGPTGPRARSGALKKDLQKLNVRFIGENPQKS